MEDTPKLMIYKDAVFVVYLNVVQYPWIGKSPHCFYRKKDDDEKNSIVIAGSGNAVWDYADDLIGGKSNGNHRDSRCN